jgi:hypothetical protein
MLSRVFRPSTRRPLFGDVIPGIQARIETGEVLLAFGVG